MEILLVSLGIILIIVFWLLNRELSSDQGDNKPETAIAPSNEPGEERTRPAWLETFIRWAGPRQAADAKRMGISLLWLLVLASLLDHLWTRSGFTGTVIALLVLLPHEAGHFLCSPFGWFLTIAGGSIWQVLLFLFFGSVAAIRKRRNEALGWLAFSGHSLISLSVYIADARTRSLRLIPIPDPARHDWGNLLEFLGLLQYDWLLAQIVIAIGGGMVLSVVVAGIFFTWYQPEKLFKQKTENP